MDSGGTPSVRWVPGPIHEGRPGVQGALQRGVDLLVGVNDEVAHARAGREAFVVITGGAEHDAAVLTPPQFGVQNDARVGLVAHDEPFSESESGKERKGGVGVGVAEAVV